MQTTNGLVVETSQDRLVLANRHLHLEFTCTPEGGWALSTLRRNGAPDRNWIVSAAGRVTPLWRARFLHEQYLPPDEGARSRWDVRLHENWVEADSLIQSQVEVSAQDDGEAATLRLVWCALPVTETGETADVTVSVTLQADSPLSQWRMEAQSTATSVGLWETHFPILGNLAAREETTLIVPAGWGQAICPAGAEEELYQGHYPSGRCVMQLMCLTDDQETIYFAAADPAAYYKRLLVKGNSAQESVEMSIVQYPETMGDLRNRYASPYAVEIGVLPGDWYTAAKHYRSWALNAPWTVKGPIETRADTPQWIKETVLWANSAALAADAVERIVQETTAFADYFGVPTALHWYSWHEIPFDDHYPDYFPAKPGFKEAVAALQRAGVKVMPYINGRLWDPRTESWFADGAVDACTKTREQQKYVESYASKVVLAAMCPATELWQGKVSGIVERLAGEFGVSAVYIDQIGAASPNLCFDHTHGHTRGGGDFWVRGYETLLTQAKARGRQDNPDLALTTEDAAEAYGAQLDAFLMCNSTRPNLVPLYPAVYSGIFLTFGRYIFEEDLADPAAFRTKLGQMFVWGAQLCWMAPGFILRPEYAQEAAFLRELAQSRAAHRAYLAFGEMVHPPQIETDASPVQTKWCMWNPDADFAIQPLMEIRMDAVQTAAWRHSRDRRWALFFVNISEQPVDLRWSFAPDDAGVQMAGELSLPALSVRVVELTPEAATSRPV